MKLEQLYFWCGKKVELSSDPHLCFLYQGPETVVGEQWCRCAQELHCGQVRSAPSTV